jgi:hypothetical protein
MELSIFREAEVLAAFSNLEVSEDEYFRDCYPGFFPEDFWDLLSFRAAVKGESPSAWRQVQQLLRQAWQDQFPFETCVALICSLSHSIRSYNRHTDGIESKYWPFQMATLFLCVEPWRARICVCGKRFVANELSKRFCSARCLADSRKLPDILSCAGTTKAGMQRKDRFTKAKAQKNKGDKPKVCSLFVAKAGSTFE